MSNQKWCIQGDKERAGDIATFFEVMGISNDFSITYLNTGFYYFADCDRDAMCAGNIPEGYTLITLQESCLLPSEWCVEECEDVLDYLNVHEMAKIIDSGKFYGQADGNHWRWNSDPFALLLTKQQFIELSKPLKKMEEVTQPNKNVVEKRQYAVSMFIAKTERIGVDTKTTETLTIHLVQAISEEEAFGLAYEEMDKAHEGYCLVLKAVAEIPTRK